MCAFDVRPSDIDDVRIRLTEGGAFETISVPIQSFSESTSSHALYPREMQKSSGSNR